MVTLKLLAACRRYVSPDGKQGHHCAALPLQSQRAPMNSNGTEEVSALNHARPTFSACLILCGGEAGVADAALHR